MVLARPASLMTRRAVDGVALLAELATVLTLAIQATKSVPVRESQEPVSGVLIYLQLLRASIPWQATSMEEIQSLYAEVHSHNVKGLFIPAYSVKP